MNGVNNKDNNLTIKGDTKSAELKSQKSQN